MNETITAYEQEVMDYFKPLMKKQQFPSDYGGEDFWDDDGWLLTVSWNPTQTKLEEIAFTLLKEELQEADEDNFYEVRFKHWACGYALQINIRPIVDGRLTIAGDRIYEYIESEGDYYLTKASEDERHYEWEREMVAMHIDNDDLTTEQMDKLVTRLIHEEDVCVDGDGSLWVGSNWDLKTVIEGATDYLFGDSPRAQQRRSAEHPDQTQLFTTQEE
tara:strand:- start:5876 stop:6526 length:651 start_codon:yes stop_codon:yes gene_type:complete